MSQHQHRVHGAGAGCWWRVLVPSSVEEEEPGWLRHSPCSYTLISAPSCCWWALPWASWLGGSPPRTAVAPSLPTLARTYYRSCTVSSVRSVLMFVISSNRSFLGAGPNRAGWTGASPSTGHTAIRRRPGSSMCLHPAPNHVILLPLINLSESNRCLLQCTHITA